jgi:TolA-binding protein
MRIHLLTAVLLAGISVPATAQRDPVERRVDRLEQELRAVQRRVFPGGAAAQVQPEIEPATPGVTRIVPTGGAVADLTARVDALEAQLSAMTGQIEEANHRARQAEEALTRFREDAGARLARLESAATQAQAAEPAPTPARPAAREPEQSAAATPAPATTAPATAADPAEEAYNAGYRLWEQRRFEEAQTALQAAAQRHPRSRWASWASNLAGRAYLDDGKPATAARIFLANYQNNREGERAADSLYFLGQALTQLDRRPEACRVYDELAEVYPSMRDFIRQRLPQARRDARCTN